MPKHVFVNFCLLPSQVKNNDLVMWYVPTEVRLWVQIIFYSTDNIAKDGGWGYQ